MTSIVPMVLIVLDGFGEAAQGPHNAITSAKTPHLKAFYEQYPHRLLDCSGETVGLPPHQMGNSEVGHMNMGAGRVVYQDLSRINQAIESGAFEQLPILQELFKEAREEQKPLHILGLLSDGGVHSQLQHIQAAVRAAARQGVQKIYLHAFLDGRDTPPRSAEKYIQTMQDFFAEIGAGAFASIAGRYFAMDRDKRWDRTQAAYQAMVSGLADFTEADPLHALQAAYHRGETDEFVQPTLIHAPDEAPHLIQDGDCVLWMNYRSDRARQLWRAMIDREFQGFDRRDILPHSLVVSITPYDKALNTPVLFPPQILNNTLGEYLARQGLTQLRIAETEKYAHVTFFFNGGREEPFAGESRILVPSPNVKTYDLAPEMSAIELTDQLVQAIQSKKFNCIICNYANPDMLGHTGNFAATVKAIEVIDQCLGRVVEAAQSAGFECLITADHGNAECMFDEKTQQPHTAHTSEKIPLIYIGHRAKFKKDPIGILADIAPTLLTLMGLPIPAEMDGTVLVNIQTGETA